MKLTIQNLQDSGSTALLRSILDDMDLSYNKDIQLGQLVMNTFLPAEKIAQLERRLAEQGLSIIYQRKEVLSEQVKYVVLDMLKSAEPPVENYSTYISSRLNLNYTYLANVFSESQGITIEHFIINQKIEKAKMLLLYEDHSIGQIAEILHYSSIGHLSNQFKKVTGMNPSDFKKQAKKAAFQ